MSGLSSLQTRGMICFGIIGWFVAALVVRFGAPAGLFEGEANLVLYLATVLVWVPAHVLLKKVLGLGPGQIVPALSLGVGTAALCDGVAMPWATWLYGSDATAMFRGAGWILWFVGVGLFVALLDARRSARP